MGSLSNGYCSSSSGVLPKYKPRMVSAVRDFPPGCGRSAPPIQRPQETADVSEADGIKASDIGVGSAFHEEVKSLVRVEMETSFDEMETSTMVDRVEKLPTDVEDVVTELPEGLENNASEVPEESHKVEVLASVKEELHELPDGLENDAMELSPKGDVHVLVKKESDEVEFQALVKKESHEVEAQPMVRSLGPLENNTVLEIGALVDGLVPVVSAKSWSPPQWPISDANASEGTDSKNKFPRRRVSAVRDFPQFCGRNAPQLTEEDRLRIISGNKSVGAAQKAGVESGELRETLVAGLEGGTLKGSVRAGGEDSELNARDGNVQMTESKEIVPEPRNKSHSVIQRHNENTRGLVGQVGKEIVVYLDDKGFKRRSSGDDVDLEPELDRVIVQALIAAPNCPWRQGKGALTGPYDITSRSKVRKRDFTGVEKSALVIRKNNQETNHLGGKSMKEKSISGGKAAYGDIGDLVVRDNKDDVLHNEEPNENSPANRRAQEFDVSLPPFGPNSSSHGDARKRVRETLRLFQAICRKVLQAEEAKLRQGKEAKSKKDKKEHIRIDLIAAKIVGEKGKEVNAGKQLGAVPGVEVGDEFQYRVELALVGVHRLYQAGIDYLKHGKVIVASSIVASGGYNDEVDDANVLVYSGQGGNLVGKNKQPEDQKLERGNLALKNSISERNPVRVIRGSRETKAVGSSDAKAKVITTYVYDGLYLVESYWQEVGEHGKLVFKFQLRRLPGQPELAWKEVKKSKKFKTREGLCVKDISGGKELFPICAVNTVDSEKPPTFSYITRMRYPDWYQPIPPKGCDCSGRCSDSKTCLCALKNGGEIPYNYNGAIVEVKQLVYECGPSCNCSSSCYNRVSQHGIKIQLEIFKTESRGWGVRSLNSIPSGSFICEYMGLLLEDKEAEQRAGIDEYLFDIGQNYYECSLKPDAQASSSEVGEDGSFTIDAAEYGNVGRFINHSCSPNLYAQNVLYDHEDKKMPHIMLFAAENIPPLKELTYHYNYTVDQIHDSDGNIKMKSCYCGSTECTGRMY